MGNETLAVELETRQVGTAGAVEGAGGEEGGSGENCVAAIVGTDVSQSENMYVVGDAFLKNWYSVFNYENAEGGPSVSFAVAI